MCSPKAIQLHSHHGLLRYSTAVFLIAMEWHHHKDQSIEKSPAMNDNHRLWATITGLKRLLTTWCRGGYNFFCSTRIHCPRCMPLLLAWKERLMAEAWVSVDEVAKHLGVAKDSVYRWIEHKDLPAHKLGRLWKCKLSEVDAWPCTCTLRIITTGLSGRPSQEQKGLDERTLTASQRPSPPCGRPRSRPCGRTSPAQAPSSGCCPPPLVAHTPTGCGHGGTRNRSTSRSVHTRSANPAAIAGVQGCHCLAEPVPMVDSGCRRGLRKLLWGKQKL